MDDKNFLDAEIRKRIILRDFPLAGSLDIYVLFGGGIGNIVLTIQTVMAMLNYLSANTNSHHRIHAYLTRRAHRIFSRLLNRLQIFSSINEYPKNINVRHLEVNNLTEINQYLNKPTNSFRLLHAFPNPIRIEHTSFINTFEHLWALWGLPGYYQLHQTTSAPSFYLDELCVLPTVKTYVDTLPEKYICYFYSANSGDSKKRWPSKNAMQTFRILYELAGIKTVAIGRKQSLFNNNDNYQKNDLEDESFIIKLSSKKFRNMSLDDFIYLQKNAVCTLSIDTGPAHICGLFEFPCITLWGPTNPSYYSQKSNTNIRVSTCPACHATPMYELCNNNQCMKDIDGTLIAKLLMKKIAVF